MSYATNPFCPSPITVEALVDSPIKVGGGAALEAGAIPAGAWS